MNQNIPAGGHRVPSQTDLRSDQEQEFQENFDSACASGARRIPFASRCPPATGCFRAAKYQLSFGKIDYWGIGFKTVPILR